MKHVAKTNKYLCFERSLIRNLVLGTLGRNAEAVRISSYSICFCVGHIHKTCVPASWGYIISETSSYNLFILFLLEGQREENVIRKER